MNVTRCDKCNRSLIVEELQTHQCKEQVLDYKIKGDVLWLFNGFGWYPQKLTQNQPIFDKEKNNRGFDRFPSSNIYKLNTTAIDG